MSERESNAEQLNDIVNTVGQLKKMRDEYVGPINSSINTEELYYEQKTRRKDRPQWVGGDK